MTCPVCDNVNLVMSERQGVEIDYCPQCRGVWLDRGELDKILERSAASASPPPEREYSGAREQPRGHGHGHGYRQEHDHDKSHGYGHKKKREGLLEALFDF